MQIIDLSNPSTPQLVKIYHTNALAKRINVSGNYAYVTEGSGGLNIIDINNPAAPVLVGTYNHQSKVMGLDVSGDYAYIADYYKGVEIINISDPSNFILTGFYQYPTFLLLCPSFEESISLGHSYTAFFFS